MQGPVQEARLDVARVGETHVITDHMMQSQHAPNTNTEVMPDDEVRQISRFFEPNPPM